MENLPQKVDKFGSDKVFPVLLARYFREEIAGKSPLTIKAKKDDLKKFLIFYQAMNGHLRADEWMVRDTRLFLDELQKQSYSPATINRVLATLKSFGSWLREVDVLRVLPCKGITELHLEPLPPKAIRDIEFHRLNKSADVLVNGGSAKYSQDFRNKVMLATLDASGLRVSELLNLKSDQLQGKKLVNVRCKGGHVRDVLIRQDVAEMIREYVEQQRVAGSSFLFTNRYGGQISRNGVANAFDKIAGYANASLPIDQHINLTPHLLRHRHGFKCREAKDPVFAAKRLGHRSLTYVERYSKMNDGEESVVLEKV